MPPAVRAGFPARPSKPGLPLARALLLLQLFHRPPLLAVLRLRESALLAGSLEVGATLGGAEARQRSLSLLRILADACALELLQRARGVRVLLRERGARRLHHQPADAGNLGDRLHHGSRVFAAAEAREHREQREQEDERADDEERNEVEPHGGETLASLPVAEGGQQLCLRLGAEVRRRQRSRQLDRGRHLLDVLVAAVAGAEVLLEAPAITF